MVYLTVAGFADWVGILPGRISSTTKASYLLGKFSLECTKPVVTRSHTAVAKPLRLAELTFQNQTGSKTVTPLSDRLLIHSTVNLACNMLQIPHVFKSQEEVDN